MDSSPTQTVVAAFGALVSAHPTRPLMTFYDDATGERTELSAASMANWVAKTANLLVDGLGLGRGDTAAIRLPAHWQTGAVLLGCWSAGLTVCLGGTSPAAVAFVSPDRLTQTSADETYALALVPLAMPFTAGPPPGTLDYALEVRGFGDHFSAPGNVGATTALADGTTHGDLVRAALGRGVPAGGRILVDGEVTSDPVSWLVAPLLVGTSVVLCRNLDAARVPARLASEHATAYP